MVPYLPVGIGIAILYTALHGLSAVDRSWGWFPTLTLFPTEAPPALSVAWTLQHELIFYAFYAVIFFSGRLLTGLIAWSVAITANAALGLDLSAFFRFFLSAINLEFIFGIVAAWMLLKNRVPSAISAITVSIISLSVWVYLGSERSQSALVGLAIAAVIPTICRFEVNRGFKVPRLLVFLGAASYAIYLIHNPIVSVVCRLIVKIGVTDWYLGLLLVVAVSTTAGVLYYWLYEKRVMEAVRNKSAKIVTI